MEQLAGAFHPDQRQEREAREIAGLCPGVNDETVDRVVEEVVRACDRGEDAEQRGPAAIENCHQRDRHQIKEHWVFRPERRQFEIQKDKSNCGYGRKYHGGGHRVFQKPDQASPRAIAALCHSIAEPKDGENRQKGRKFPYSTTILTSPPGLRRSPGNSPLSTRNRSAARSATAILPASLSTVSPGATVTIFRRSGFAASISARLMRRKVPTDSRNERSVSGVRCFAAKMKR